MIKVLLVDDHDMVRDGIRRILEESKDIKVISEAENGKEAIKKVKKYMPDVLVLDISMPGIDGIEVINQLISDYSKLRILILTMHEESQYAVHVIQAGAMGYLTKRSAPDELRKAIRKVHSGKLYLTDQAAELLARRIAEKNNDKSDIELLSSREIEILTGLALGRAIREIAEMYNISIKTVHAYKSRVCEKLDLENNIAKLTQFAIKHGLIKI